MKNIIRAEELYFNYCPNHNIPDIDKKWILENINFSIDKGEFIVVAGSNGSGKSTLLRLIDLLELPSRGKIYIYNKDAYI